jgi:hypothetical protein
LAHTHERIAGHTLGILLYLLPNRLAGAGCWLTRKRHHSESVCWADIIPCTCFLFCFRGRLMLGWSLALDLPRINFGWRDWHSRKKRRKQKRFSLSFGGWREKKKGSSRITAIKLFIRCSHYRPGIPLEKRKLLFIVADK